MRDFLNNFNFLQSTLGLDYEFYIYTLPYIFLVLTWLVVLILKIVFSQNSFNELLTKFKFYKSHVNETSRQPSFFNSLNQNFTNNFSASLPFTSNFTTKFNFNTNVNLEYLFRPRSSRFVLFFQNAVHFTILSFQRVPYYIKNWVYSTNHKRIAVNYFWFVVISGVCGMILATIIRLEMAYPGVGILAGDSLQYLSIVTAHAVIMVFFMIMPLVFGAFGNFLLPTQLGVHDVAFPRLNSAAFWFLPGGLLMLAQLVCLDRRYQRMNCFNIRELQTLLKNRYHPDLVDERLYTDFLAQTTLSTRFKLFNTDLITPRMSIFHDYSLANSKLSRKTTLTNSSQTFQEYFTTNINSFLDTHVAIYVRELQQTFAWPSYYQTLTNVTLSTNSRLNELNTSYGNTHDTPSITTVDLNTPNTVFNSLRPHVNIFSSNPVTLISELVKNFLLLITTYPTLVLESLINVKTYIFFTDITSNLNWSSSIATIFNNSNPSFNTSSASHIELSNTETFALRSTKVEQETLNHERTGDYRFQKAQNPVFKYDFKVGHYLTDNVKVLSRQLFTTFNDTTGGVRKAPWYFSPDFFTPLKIDVLTYLAYFDIVSFSSAKRNSYISQNASLSRDFHANAGYLATPSPTSSFYNFFNSFSKNSNFLNLRWLSLNALDQKFHNMYTSTSMQQRIYGNWRQLKFSREAWRCKLLASRHQNTLSKRYIHEDSVVWSVERNAKDVLPGWAMITPFSARTRFTAIGKVDIGLFGVFLVINASIVSSANFLVTYRYLSTLNNRKMRDARSFFSEGMIVASWMIIAANPMLAIGILMLLSDRHWQTSFFDYSGGGDTVLFQHMFWFFGHPEVYIIMIPTFGFNNTILSFYLRKRVSARASLMYSMYTIAFLGFFVWGHHMYMVGLAHTTRMLFSTLTVMISVPAATKLMHWSVTIVNSSITMELPLLFQFLFIFFFTSGGVSGMCVAHVGMDVLFHDSFYVVGHFHVMFAGAAMFGSFGAFYFYFPSIFGVKFNRIWGYLHVLYYTIGQLMTVIPMLWLGYAGMPRRVLDYPASMGGWHSIASAGHLLSVAGLLSFFVMIFDSLRARRAVTRATFGVARFNTRLNFYIYEGARTWFLQRKGWYNARTQIRNELEIDEIPYRNYELLETTLFSYVLFDQRNVRKDKTQ